MEGVTFRETPEQSRERQLRNIAWKQAHCQALSVSDYELLNERQQQAGEELAGKFFG